MTKQNIAECAALLSHLEPGFLPHELYAQIARIVRLPFVDLIPIKRNGSHTSIGLVKRDSNDQWWPDAWHLPGTLLRADDTIATACERLKQQELSLKASDEPVFHGISVHHSTRGAEVVLIHTIESCVFNDDSEVQWFSVDELPDNFIPSELNVVSRLRESLIG